MTHVSAVYDLALTRLDSDLARVVTAAEPSCRPGCDACCYYPARVRPPELARLREAYVALPRLARRTVEKQLRRAARRLAAIRQFRGFPESEPERLAYCGARIQCPLLVGGKCRVYGARPAVCRTHFVVSDPGLCRGGHQPVISLDLTSLTARFHGETGAQAHPGELLIDALLRELGTG